jgi:hypothetical protein
MVFVADKSGTGQISFGSLRLSPHTIMPPLLHAERHLCSVYAFIRRTNGAVQCSFGYRGALNKNILTILGKGFQNINGPIVCFFANCASTTDVIPE